MSYKKVEEYNGTEYMELFRRVMDMDSEAVVEHDGGSFGLFELQDDIKPVPTEDVQYITTIESDDYRSFAWCDKSGRVFLFKERKRKTKVQTWWQKHKGKVGMAFLMLGWFAFLDYMGWL